SRRRRMPKRVSMRVEAATGALRKRLRHVWFQRFKVYPPFLGAGVRVVRVGDDLCSFDVELDLRPWNKSGLGTDFGAALYMMREPFFAVTLRENLGDGYEVSDRHGSVLHKKSGRGTVKARVHIDPLELDAVRAQVDLERKVERVFRAAIVDDKGEVVA